MPTSISMREERKISPKQKEIIQKMREGWQLTTSMTTRNASGLHYTRK